MPEADRYQVQYRIADTNTWTRVSTSRTNKTLTRLRTATDYEVRFRSRCPGGYTQYGITYGFSTLSGRLSTDSGQALSDYEAIEFHRMYPNPTTDQLNLDYMLDLEGDVAITVYDMLGRRVISKSLQQEEGIQKAQFMTAQEIDMALLHSYKTIGLVIKKYRKMIK